MTETPTMPNAATRDQKVRALVKKHGGGWCGPHVEHIDMTEQAFFEMIADPELAAALATPSPPPDEGVPKLTREELAALFGPTMPMDVAMFVSCTDKPLIEVRKEVYRHALALASPVPPDVSGVVERLRAKRVRVHDLGGVGFETDPDCEEAASLLLSLASEREGQKAENERLKSVQKAFDALNELRSDEGSSVTLLCDNPDFDGQPNNAIICNGDWTNWEDRRFADETIGETIAAALKAFRHAKEK